MSLMKCFTVKNLRTIDVHSHAYQMIFNAMKYNKCCMLNCEVCVTYGNLRCICNTVEVLDAENIRSVSPSLFHKLLLLECSENVNCIAVVLWLCIKVLGLLCPQQNVTLASHSECFYSGVQVENNIWNIFLGPVLSYLNVHVISFWYTFIYRWAVYIVLYIPHSFFLFHSNTFFTSNLFDCPLNPFTKDLNSVWGVLKDGF